MPIYEFVCSYGHRFEVILSIAEKEKLGRDNISFEHDFTPFERLGQRCKALAELAWAAPANISIGKPTIIFRDAKNPNKVQVATSSHDKAPEGYLTEELRNPIERSKFENERQKILDVENEMISESVKIRDSATRNNRHSEITRNMSQYDSGTQELLKFVMGRTRKKKERVKKSSVRLDINHIDNSNLVK